MPRGQYDRTRKPEMGLVQTTNPVQTADLMKAAIGGDITVSIPEGATLEQVENTLEVAITGYRRLSEASERLKPVIGRILLTVQERKLFKGAYKNFTAYVMEKVVGGMGFGRSNAFEALRIARAFPSMDAATYQKYGANRLMLAASVTDETEENFQDVLESLASVTVEEARQRVKALKNEGKEPSELTHVISIRVSDATFQEWRKILQNEEDSSPSDIFSDMVSSHLTQFSQPKKPIQAVQAKHAAKRTA